MAEEISFTYPTISATAFKLFPCPCGCGWTVKVTYPEIHPPEGLIIQPGETWTPPPEQSAPRYDWVKLTDTEIEARTKQQKQWADEVGERIERAKKKIWNGEGEGFVLLKANVKKEE